MRQAVIFHFRPFPNLSICCSGQRQKGGKTAGNLNLQILKFAPFFVSYGAIYSILIFFAAKSAISIFIFFADSANLVS